MQFWSLSVGKVIYIFPFYLDEVVPFFELHFITLIFHESLRPLVNICSFLTCHYYYDCCCGGCCCCCMLILEKLIILDHLLECPMSSAVLFAILKMAANLESIFGSSTKISWNWKYLEYRLKNLEYRWESNTFARYYKFFNRKSWNINRESLNDIGDILGILIYCTKCLPYTYACNSSLRGSSCIQDVVFRVSFKNS